MTGKQLVQGCYAVAWAGVEPTTFELQGRILSTEPRRPNTKNSIFNLPFQRMYIYHDEYAVISNSKNLRIFGVTIQTSPKLSSKVVPSLPNSILTVFE